MNITYLIEMIKKEPLKTGKVGRPRLIEVVEAGKIGFTGRENGQRYTEHLRNENYDIDKIVILREYKFEVEDDALSFEAISRKYLRSKYEDDFVRNDRFEGVEFSKEDLAYLDRKYQEALAFFSI